MIRSSLLLSSLLFSLSCLAETYYVSNSGNNSNNGLSPQTAFLTLQKASNTVIAGDTVIVLAGTYVGFYHTQSGTANDPIIFSAQPGVLINQPNATTDDGINLEGSDYVIVEGFNVYGVPRTGIRSVTNEGVIIRNNVCDSCGVWGILTGFSENILIEYNECSRSVDEHGIYFGNSADNPIIRNNICWGNNACGIHMNGDASLGGGGIISNALVENNIIYNNGAGGGSGINCDGVQDSRIQNNLLYNNVASGISLYRIDGGGGSMNNVVVHNTILQPANGRWALNISDGSTDNIVFNNIFYSAHAFRGSIAIDAASLAGLHSDYNVLTNRMSVDGGNTVLSLAQWQQATSLDNNSVIAALANLFVNPAQDDYHLLSTAAAKDLGVGTFYSVLAPNADIENTPRPQGSTFDAGAYEFQVPTGLAPVSSSSVSWNDLTPSNLVRLYDRTGKLVLVGRKSEINLIEFVPGIYVFNTWNTGDIFLSGKFIVIGMY